MSSGKLRPVIVVIIVVVVVAVKSASHQDLSRIDSKSPECYCSESDDDISSPALSRNASRDGKPRTTVAIYWSLSRLTDLGFHKAGGA